MHGANLVVERRRLDEDLLVQLVFVLEAASLRFNIEEVALVALWIVSWVAYDHYAVIVFERKRQ